MRGFSEKSIIVTGGGNGIGAAVAVRFGEAGAHVAVWDIDTEAAENVAAGIRDAGGQAVAIRCDITNYDAVGAAVAASASAVMIPALASLESSASRSRVRNPRPRIFVVKSSISKSSSSNPVLTHQCKPPC